MLIKNNIIFIHIQRTAGTSIESFIKNNKFEDNKLISKLEHVPKKHTCARSVKMFVGDDQYNKSFIFTIVRNPWDRLVSSYLFKKSKNWNHKGWEYESQPSFTEWITHYYSLFKNNNFKLEYLIYNKSLSRKILEIKNMHHVSAFRSQLDMIQDKGGVKLVDYIGYYEKLNAEWKYLLQKMEQMNLEIKKENKYTLPHNNKTKRKHYSDYYNEETKRMISELFSEDLYSFGYSF